MQDDVEAQQRYPYLQLTQKIFLLTETKYPCGKSIVHLNPHSLPCFSDKVGTRNGSPHCCITPVGQHLVASWQQPGFLQPEPLSSQYLRSLIQLSSPASNTVSLPSAEPHILSLQTSHTADLALPALWQIFAAILHSPIPNSSAAFLCGSIWISFAEGMPYPFRSLCNAALKSLPNVAEQK